jgi:thiol:disulfide interchange protein
MVLAVVRVEGGALSLTSANIDQVIADNQLVLLNFYAEWCR